MTHIARQRIKVGGLYYAAGDPVELTEADLADLPKGAASPRTGEAADIAPASDPVMTIDEQAKAALEVLTAAVDALTPEDFRQDGEIRAGALRALNETLGFEVTAEDVAAVRVSDNGAGA